MFMRKLIALPFGLIFVVLLLATAVVFSVRGFAFDPTFYTTALKNEGLFQAIQNDPTAYFDWGGQLSAFNPLPPETQRRIFNAAVPISWLEQQVGGAITSVLVWLHSDQPPPPRISIDFRPIKDRLQGPPGLQIATDVVASIPDCTPDQHPDLSGASVPECLPTGIDRAATADFVAGLINQAAGEIPNGVDVGPSFTSSGRWASLITGRSWIRLLDVGIVLLVAVTFLFWFVGALIAGRDFKEGLRWAGGWLLGGSIIVLGLGVLMLIARDALFSSASFMRSAADNLTPAALIAIRNVAATFIQQFAIRMIVPAGILFVLSFGLIVMGRNKNRENSLPAQPQL
jgi:hypothetical protein